ncbi:MAG: hypothetical protein ACOY31_01765 [Bacillota bacterium]
MSREKTKQGRPLELEPKQHKTIDKEKNESVLSGIMKGLFFLALTAIVYFLVFSNSQKVLDLLSTKNYTAPIISMSIILLVSYLFGTGINKLIKSTLERALESQKLREE